MYVPGVVNRKKKDYIYDTTLSGLVQSTILSNFKRKNYTPQEIESLVPLAASIPIPSTPPDSPSSTPPGSSLSFLHFPFPRLPQFTAPRSTSSSSSSSSPSSSPRSAPSSPRPARTLGNIPMYSASLLSPEPSGTVTQASSSTTLVIQHLTGGKGPELINPSWVEVDVTKYETPSIHATDPTGKVYAPKDVILKPLKPIKPLKIQIPSASQSSSKSKTPPLEETIKRISFPDLPPGHRRIDPTYSEVPEGALYNKKYNYHYVPNPNQNFSTKDKDYTSREYDDLIGYNAMMETNGLMAYELLGEKSIQFDPSKVIIPPVRDNQKDLPREEQIKWYRIGPYYFVLDSDAHKLEPRDPSRPYVSPHKLGFLSDKYSPAKEEALRIPKVQQVIAQADLLSTLPIQQSSKTSPKQQAEQEVLNIFAAAKLPEGATSGPDWYVQRNFEKYDPAVFQPEEGARLFKLGNDYFINRDDIGLLKRIKPFSSASSSRETKPEILPKKAKSSEDPPPWFLKRDYAEYDPEIYEPTSKTRVHHEGGKSYIHLLDDRTLKMIPFEEQMRSKKSSPQNPFGTDYVEIDLAHYKPTPLMKTDSTTGKHYMHKDETLHPKSSPQKRGGAHKSHHKS